MSEQVCAWCWGRDLGPASPTVLRQRLPDLLLDAMKVMRAGQQFVVGETPEESELVFMFTSGGQPFYLALAGRDDAGWILAVTAGGSTPREAMH
jgi:hypothetical protein